MAPKFLCCLPLRLGVFVISFLQFLVCGAFAAFLWWALYYDSRNDAVEFAKHMKVTVIVVASIYTAVASVSLLGFLGAVFRKNQFVKTFYFLLCICLAFQVGAGIWYLVTFYTTRNETIADCLNKGSADQTRIDYCNAIQVYKRFPQEYVLSHVIVPIVIQIYACYVVYSYSKRINYQDAEKNRQPLYNQGPVYQPVSRQDETYPLTHPNVVYPYADAPHSFGSKA